MSEEHKQNGNGAESVEPLLDNIDGPLDLHGLTDAQLQQVAGEMRTYIIDTIGQIGGHFGANLGTCELTVALHSLLESPRDKILWDVGHQSYPHKIHTARTTPSPAPRTNRRRSASTRASPLSARSPSPSTTSWAPAMPRPRSAT